ncbi:MAG: hypothetical protein HZA18_01835 [Nitrospirae bacterium]|nr:hypothetical protein [Nitrospirota bacterium]
MAKYIEAVETEEEQRDEAGVIEDNTAVPGMIVAIQTFGSDIRTRNFALGICTLRTSSRCRISRSKQIQRLYQLPGQCAQKQGVYSLCRWKN